MANGEANRGVDLEADHRRKWAIENLRIDFLAQWAFGFVAAYVWSTMNYESRAEASIGAYFLDLFASSQLTARRTLGDWSPADLGTLLTVLAALVVAGAFAQQVDERSRAQLSVVRQAARAAGLLTGIFAVFVAIESAVAASFSVVEVANSFGIAGVTTVAVSLIDIFNDDLARFQHRASANYAGELTGALEAIRTSTARHLEDKNGRQLPAIAALSPLSLVFAGLGVVIALGMTARLGRSYDSSYWSGIAFVGLLYTAASIAALMCLVSLRVKAELRPIWRTAAAIGGYLLPWLLFVWLVSYSSVEGAILVAPAFLLPWIVYGFATLALKSERRLPYFTGRWLGRAIDEAAIARLARHAARAAERAARAAAVGSPGEGS